MLWRVWLRSIAMVLVLAALRSAGAQRGVEPTGSNFHRVALLDSIEFSGMGASPDGRWITISAFEGGYPGIWIMPADGSAKPTRLLPAGYSDIMPMWFPAGSRLAFLSDRMSRDGSPKSYVMTVEIDPKTGKTATPPRQISPEETPLLGPVSPDGKWVAYLSPKDSTWKAVPVTGGTPRTLAKMATAGGPMMWSQDGQSILFAIGNGGRSMPPYGIWYKVSIKEGTPIRAYSNQDAMPYLPNTDMHVVFHRRSVAEGGGIRRVELYDEKEQLVGATDLANGMNLFFPRGATRGMYATATENRYENSLLTLNGGNTRTVAASRFAWVNGWVDNATMLIDGHDADQSFVATLDTAGHEGRRVVLPADAKGMGWGGTVGYATPFSRGSNVPKPSDPYPLYIADARTGAISQLAADAHDVSTDGDRFYFTVVNGQQRELRAVTVDGHSTLLRSFAKSDVIRAIAVRGEMFAWVIPSNDSMTVFAARGQSGRPLKLTTVKSSPFSRFEIRWSFDGSMLAVTGISAEPALSVIHVDESGSPRGAPVILNSGATQLWSMRWVSDNRALVLTGTPAGMKNEVLMRVPVNPAEAPTFYGRNDEWPVVSPDGKRVAYPAVRSLGTTIWRVDFVPTSKTGSKENQ